MRLDKSSMKVTVVEVNERERDRDELNRKAASEVVAV